jgi:hypothetical protein
MLLLAPCSHLASQAHRALMYEINKFQNRASCRYKRFFIFKLKKQNRQTSNSHRAWQCIRLPSKSSPTLHAHQSEHRRHAATIFFLPISLSLSQKRKRKSFLHFRFNLPANSTAPH